jgi:endonuclease-3
MNKTEKALAIIHILRKATRGMALPMSEDLAQKFGHDPFVILISCLLSLRSRDVMTYKVSMSLFKKVITPQELLEIPLSELEEEIRPIGFYKRKAQILKEVSHELLTRFGGNVPCTYKDLRSIKGVGPKTANLVLGVAFKIPAICVDIHVHRISNRLGLVKTKRPEDTEKELKEILPEEYWIEWNKLLVMWGQNICVPVSPFCSQCAIFDLCERNGVKKMR